MNKISLGGGTCYTCALQAAKRSFDEVALYGGLVPPERIAAHRAAAS